MQENAVKTSKTQKKRPCDETMRRRHAPANIYRTPDVISPTLPRVAAPGAPAVPIPVKRIDDANGVLGLTVFFNVNCV